LAYLKRLLEDSCSGTELPAAVIVETAQMDGGVYVASAEWLQELRQLTRAHDILLICDDIQVGCGRSGQFFSFERAGIVPDLVTLSKSIGGYGFPMALLLMRADLDQWRPGEHTGTFRGNQVSFVAATAALDFWAKEDFRQGLAQRSAYFSKLTHQVAPQEEVRGLGMVYGVDVAKRGGAERAQRVQALCFERGLVIETCGREDTVIKLLPPIITGNAELEAGCDILASALRDA
jgi:diaminobutyrate-2-oxoglutarate transaminase